MAGKILSIFRTNHNLMIHKIGFLTKSIKEKKKNKKSKSKNNSTKMAKGKKD